DPGPGGLLGRVVRPLQADRPGAGADFGRAGRQGDHRQGQHRRQPHGPVQDGREGHPDPDAVQGRPDDLDEGRRHAQGQDRRMAGRSRREGGLTHARLFPPPPGEGGLGRQAETGWGRRRERSAAFCLSVVLRRSGSPGPPRPVASRPPSPGRGGRSAAPRDQAGQVSRLAPSTSPARYSEPQMTTRPAPRANARSSAASTDPAAMAPKPRPWATAARASGSAAAPSKPTVKTWASIPFSASKKPPASLLAR